MAAPSFVNATNGSLGSGTTIVLPSFSVTAGNAILVFCRVNTNSTTVTGITDTDGNTYTQLLTYTNGGSRIFLWIAENIGGEANNVITVQLSASDAFKDGVAIQVEGVDADAPVSAVIPATIAATGRMELSNTLVLLMGEVAATGQTWTASAGFTKGAEDTSQVMCIFYREQDSLDLFSPSLTCTGGAGKQMFTVLLPSGDAGGGSPGGGPGGGGGTVAYASFGLAG